MPMTVEVSSSWRESYAQLVLCLQAPLEQYPLKRICISSSALSDKSCTIRIGHITFQQNSIKKLSSKNFN